MHTKCLQFRNITEGQMKKVSSFITIIYIYIVNQQRAHIGCNLALLYEIWQTMFFTHSREKPWAVQA